MDRYRKTLYEVRVVLHQGAVVTERNTSSLLTTSTFTTPISREMGQLLAPPAVRGQYLRFPPSVASPRSPWTPPGGGSMDPPWGGPPGGVQKWPKMAKNGQKWPKMAIFPPTAPLKWASLRIHQNGGERTRLAPKGAFLGTKNPKSD